MTSTVQTPDILAAIVAATRRVVTVRSAVTPLDEIDRRAASVQPRPGLFREALARADRINVIAECKRRSPSRGVLKAEYDPAVIAAGYERAGAAAISVLTEPTFFDGSIEHLAAVRRATALPILRKDFIVDRYQVLEARAAGADAILLIVAALSPAALKSLHEMATGAGLDVLVEIHDLFELPIALDAGASIIGINNRNLRTLAVDTEVSGAAVELIPDSAVAVAESGLRTRDDLTRLKAAGYDAFLVGERLMTTEDPGRALAGLLEGM
ncbi:MAG: indole-3-glycerol phosphate synthase TrpC [Acidobacteria bacterium]|nr:MAG: indole-3-glycerol phosphate synthase TrpC [Acidobacteriota bacterium]